MSCGSTIKIKPGDSVPLNGTIMLNGGEVNYASPPATAGAWPGSPGPYSNVPSLSFDYLYTP